MPKEMIKMNNSLKQIAKEIKKAKSIAIFTHINPDFDAFGSSMPLYYVLKKLNKHVVLFSKNKLTYQEGLLLDPSIICSEDCREDDFDLFISTDTPALHRLGDYSKIFENTNNNTIVLDHHNNYDLKGKFNFIDPTYSSCSEITFEILKLMKVKIEPFVATILYAGLSSDTNSFVNGNTNSASFMHGYELSKLNADLIGVNQKLYRTKTLVEIDFKKYLYANYKVKDDIAYCVIDYKTIKSLKGEKVNCSGFSTDLISIENINYSFSITEDETGLYDISFRAKQGFSVNNIASALGGGGHVCASGAKIKAKSADSLVKKVISLIEKNKKQNRE